MNDNYKNMPEDSKVPGSLLNEQTQTEMALRESESRVRAITGAVRDAIIFMDDKGYIAFWNQAAEKIFGYTSEEALGQELHKLIVPEKYFAAFSQGLSHFRLTGQGDAIGKVLELSVLRKDGTEFPIELLPVPSAELNFTAMLSLKAVFLTDSR